MGTSDLENSAVLRRSSMSLWLVRSPKMPGARQLLRMSDSVTPSAPPRAPRC